MYIAILDFLPMWSYSKIFQNCKNLHKCAAYLPSKVMVVKLRHHLSVMAWNMLRFSLIFQSTNVTIANVNVLVLFWETVVFVDSCSVCAAVSACTTRSRLFARTFTKRSGNGSDSYDIQKDLLHFGPKQTSLTLEESFNTVLVPNCL